MAVSHRQTGMPERCQAVLIGQGILAHQANQVGLGSASGKYTTDRAVELCTGNAPRSLLRELAQLVDIRGRAVKFERHSAGLSFRRIERGEKWQRILSNRFTS